MQPVVGMDVVANGCSVIHAFKKRNEPYGRMETLQHGEEGFERLGEVLSILKEASGVEPVVVFKTTGHYHRGLAGYLKRSGKSPTVSFST
ncbi:hypothetical protein [Paenibacillus pabuli]|uniref:hypothetical protein n=1 Tax=Paenibacillus pabuli TaxID=1472 RepID=UPI000B129E38|nr:hypothetical protein [Paenibacillus pabuli]MEC0128482.1 hypothetical protein [Paenibacillus pabuli]